jgi:hypothetical protein
MLKYLKNILRRLGEVVIALGLAAASVFAIVVAGFFEIPVYVLTGHSVLDKLADYID